MSSNECCPSDRFNTQRRAEISLAYGLPTRGSVEISASELGFTIGVLIAVAAVVLKEIYYGDTDAQ